MGQLWLLRSLFLAVLSVLPPCLSLSTRETMTRREIEMALTIIYDVASGNLGSLCVTENYRSVFINLQTSRFDGTRQKADMAALLLQDVGVSHHNGLLDAISKSLILSDRKVYASRILSLNASSGYVVTAVTWRRPSTPNGSDSVTLLEINGPVRALEEDPKQGMKPDRSYPWYEDSNTSPVRSPKFMTSPVNVSFKGWWTFPYYSCHAKKWLLSYSVPIPPTGRHATKGFLSVDVDVSNLEINQCDVHWKTPEGSSSEISVFYGSHKCQNETSECKNKPEPGWTRGGYQCVCKPGYYPRRKGPFNGTLVEAAWQEKQLNVSHTYDEAFRCYMCAPGCKYCHDSSPCLAYYNWPFRITLLTFSLLCVVFTLALICYVFRHRRLKVFKVASPIFLGITLSGCSIMYMEMAAIFPVLDRYSCIATKWTRHLGFCITYTALLMKTWRVSLTYRVKSAHKVKLTDKQLLQWMFPILLVMLIYLGAWTLSDPPDAEIIKDNWGLKFKQCTFNWWDHSIAIGEVLFLAWGIKVCYNVRNAESFYNEAHLISFAIYNIAVVNIAMVAFHILIFPHAGPDIKYLLGFIRTQLSTSVTIALVFGPKVARVWRGQGDQWDNRARARGVTASFSLNGIGMAPEETADLYQENEELKYLGLLQRPREKPNPLAQLTHCNPELLNSLVKHSNCTHLEELFKTGSQDFCGFIKHNNNNHKEEIQKLAGQIEFMKIVHMETNNPHIKPKAGSYFHGANVQATMLQSPLGKT